MNASRSLLAFLAAASLVAGCYSTDAQLGSAGQGAGQGQGECTYDGVVHKAGESFKSTDGCNTCSCDANGAVACTVMACAETCTYGGATYVVGEKFKSTDGCNTCSCEPGGAVACTEMACVETCTYGGTTYTVGETFKSTDGCNTCSCTGPNEIACTEMACEVVCTFGGQTYKPGDTWSDGCNTCGCDETGQVMCTAMECPACTYAGKEYFAGESFPSIDGCNTCSCQADGSVACTDMACECKPEDEWWRKYFSSDPAGCAALDCLPNTTGFSNACGCGCEQSAECPEWFDCMPPKPCDVKKIQEECPYSGIAY